MSQILDDSFTSSVVEVVLNAQDDSGFSDEEFIPGLVQSILDIADRHPENTREQLLDEAANLLADG